MGPLPCGRGRATGLMALWARFPPIMSQRLEEQQMGCAVGTRGNVPVNLRAHQAPPASPGRAVALLRAQGSCLVVRLCGQGLRWGPGEQRDPLARGPSGALTLDVDGDCIIAVRVSGKQKLVLQQVVSKVDLEKNFWPLRSLIGGTGRRGSSEPGGGRGRGLSPRFEEAPGTSW